MANNNKLKWNEQDDVDTHQKIGITTEQHEQIKSDKEDGYCFLRRRIQVILSMSLKTMKT